MGTIAEKLTYLNGTKQALKESINNLGGDITSETTFREYAQELDNIYDNLPKITGEDTNLSLTTLKGKMNITPKGNTQQDTYEGYNLLPYIDRTRTHNGITFTNHGDGTITANGTSTDIAIYRINVDSETTTRNVTLSAGTYYIVDGVGDYTNYFTQATNGTDYLNTGSTGTIGKSGSITTTTTTDWAAYIYIRSGVTLNNKVFKPMIVTSANVNKPFEKYVGGTASPNPSYPQNIEVVTGTQEVKVGNANLFNKILDNKILTWAGGTEYNETGSIVGSIFITQANTKIISNYAFNIFFFDKNNTYLGNGSNIATTSQPAVTSITIPNNSSIYYAQLEYRKSSNNNEDMTQKTNVMANIGDTLYTYTPHQEQTQIVSLGDIELCKIGNYQDYLYKSGDKWYKKEYIGKYNGKLTYSEYNSTYQRAKGHFDTSLFASTSNTAGYCNIGTMATTGSVNEIKASGIMYLRKDGTTGNQIYLWYSGITDSTTAQTFFTNTTSDIRWVLTTPNDIEITDTNLITQLNNLEKAQSYNGTTNISSSGNLSAILGVSALKGE